MKLISQIKAWWQSRQPRPPAEWYFVEFDEQRVVLRASPPGQKAWEQSFLWASVIRVCFKDEGPYASDVIYVFTSERTESFVVPTEAKGGGDFFGAIASRGLFPPAIMAKAISSTDGGLYCWPP